MILWFVVTLSSKMVVDAYDYFEGEGISRPKKKRLLLERDEGQSDELWAERVRIVKLNYTLPISKKVTREHLEWETKPGEISRTEMYTLYTHQRLLTDFVEPQLPKFEINTGKFCLFK